MDIPGTLVLLDKNQQINLRKKFFPALVLLECLNGICPQGVSRKTSDDPPNPNQHPQDMFFTLMNKLAQICDFRPKGDTVTAIAVIRQNGRICYVLASNRRETGALNKARAGLTDVLNILKSNLERETKVSDKELQEELFRKILEWNTVRIRSYLTLLSKEVHVCLTRCDEKDPEGIPLQSY